MKTDRTLKDWEVPSNAKDSVQFITEDLTSNIVKDFQDRLRQDGLKISSAIAYYLNCLMNGNLITKTDCD